MNWTPELVLAVGVALSGVVAALGNIYIAINQGRATRKDIQTNTAITTSAIKENTQVTTLAATKADDAYREANSVNIKIAAVGQLRRAPADKRRTEDDRESDA